MEVAIIALLHTKDFNLTVQEVLVIGKRVDKEVLNHHFFVVLIVKIFVRELQVVVIKDLI